MFPAEKLRHHCLIFGMGWVMNFDFASQITAGQRRLYAYIHSLVDSSAAAWDVLQETNIVLWRKQAEFTPGTSFDAWAFTVARFQVLAWLRDRKREPLDLMTPELVELMAEDSMSEGELFEQRLAALQKCREGLQGRSRRLLELFYESGQSVRQVAEELKMGSDAVKQGLFRMRRLLQDCIDQQVTNSEAS